MRFDEATRASRSTRVAGAAAAILVILLDQASKGYVFGSFGPGGELVLLPTLSILPGWNAGTAFGFAKGASPLLLVGVALAISAGLVALLLRTSSAIQTIGLGSAIGGAIANAADRIRFGAVRDFVDVHWGPVHWPTYNFADMFVVGGLVLFALADVLAQSRKREAR